MKINLPDLTKRISSILSSAKGKFQITYSRFQIFFNLRSALRPLLSVSSILSSAFCLLSLSLSLSLFLSFLLLSPTLSFANDEKPVGKVIGLVGTVEYLLGGEEPEGMGPDGKIKHASLPPWKPAVFRQPVFAKDKFRTQHGSRLKILFADNSLMAIGPNSSMKIESYIYKPKEKLRQGLISVAHGLSMYIINKSQKNKKSSFKIVSPTGNIAARGTQGYISSSATATLVANQVGAVEVSNSNPSVKGSEMVGAMSKTVIPKDQPPVKPVPLTLSELKQIRNVVIGRTGTSSVGGEDSLIEVEEEEVEEEEEEETAEDETETETEESTEDSDEKTETEESTEDSDEKTETEETEKEEKTEKETEEGKDEAEGKEKKAEGTEAEEGEQKTEEGEQKTEKGEKTEDGGQKAEGTEDRGQKAEDSGQKTEPGSTETTDSSTDVAQTPTSDTGGGFTDSPTASNATVADTGSITSPTVSNTSFDTGSVSMDFGTAFTESFTVDAGAATSDFTPVNNPFDSSMLTGCSP